MKDPVTKRLERKQADLSRIKQHRARWWGKLMRAARAIEKLNAEERRILKPKLDEKLRDNGESDEFKHQWHKIRELEFNDDTFNI